jgi:hypothetical protein
MVHDEGSSIVTSQGEPVSDVTSRGEGSSLDNSQILESSGGRLLGSAVLIGAGVLVEPELVGGALLGAGVLYALPVMGRIIRPLVTTAVRLAIRRQLRPPISCRKLANKCKASSLMPALNTHSRERIHPVWFVDTVVMSSAIHLSARGPHTHPFHNSGGSCSTPSYKIRQKFDDARG